MSRNGNDRRIYVGNLPTGIRSRDLDELFRRYGKILNVDLKDRRGPPFAFLEFDDPKDAEDAVKDRDGFNYDGYRLRVEFPRGGRGVKSDVYERRVSGDGIGRGMPSTPRRTQYRVRVTGIPPSGSWQDLKDHMREAGEVSFADVYKDGTGIVDFLRRDDMKYAIRKLDDSAFRSHEGETSYIRLTEGYGDGGRDRSRSRSRSSSRGRRARSPSRSYSRSRSRSDSRSRSRSPASYNKRRF